jgi:NADH:ubiquinone oxidoreductase subunit 6 (subunit J)
VTLKITLASIGVAAVVAATAAAFGWPLERAVYLAPVLVVTTLAVGGLLLFWGKVAAAQLRETRRPRLVLALWIGGIGLLVLLTILGVKLPKE